MSGAMPKAGVLAGTRRKSRVKDYTLSTELFNHEVEKVFLSFKTIRRIPSLNDRTLKLNKNPNEIPESLK
jgi:hypothetical protein